MKKNISIKKHSDLVNEITQVITKREISSNDDSFIEDIRELDQLVHNWFLKMKYRNIDLAETLRKIEVKK